VGLVVVYWVAIGLAFEVLYYTAITGCRKEKQRFSIMSKIYITYLQITNLSVQIMSGGNSLEGTIFESLVKTETNVEENSNAHGINCLVEEVAPNIPSVYVFSMFSVLTFFFWLLTVVFRKYGSALTAIYRSQLRNIHEMKELREKTEFVVGSAVLPIKKTDLEGLGQSRWRTFLSNIVIERSSLEPLIEMERKRRGWASRFLSLFSGQIDMDTSRKEAEKELPVSIKVRLLEDAFSATSILQVKVDSVLHIDRLGKGVKRSYSAWGRESSTIDGHAWEAYSDDEEFILKSHVTLSLGSSDQHISNNRDNELTEVSGVGQVLGAVRAIEDSGNFHSVAQYASHVVRSVEDHTHSVCWGEPLKFKIANGLCPEKLTLKLIKKRDRIVSKVGDLDAFWKVHYLVTKFGSDFFAHDRFEQLRSVAEIISMANMGEWVGCTLAEMPRYDGSGSFKVKLRTEPVCTVAGICFHQLRGIGGSFLLPAFMESFEKNKRFALESEFHSVDERKSPPEGRGVECLLPLHLVLQNQRGRSKKKKMAVGALWQTYRLILLRRARGSVVLAVVVLYFLLQPSLVQVAFSMLECEEFVSGDSYLVSDYDVKCFEGSHAKILVFLTMPTILMATLVFPLGLYLHLRHNRTKLDSYPMMLQFGFLVAGFEDEYYYWEIWGIVRKTLISLVAIGLKSYPKQQLLWFAAVCTFSVVMHARAFPYVDIEMDKMEQLSLTVSIVNAFSAIFLRLQVHVLATMVVVLLANGAFFLYFVAELLKEAKTKYQKKYERSGREEGGLGGSEYATTHKFQV